MLLRAKGTRYCDKGREGRSKAIITTVLEHEVKQYFILCKQINNHDLK